MSTTEQIKFVQWAMVNFPNFTTERRSYVLAMRKWRGLNRG